MERGHKGVFHEFGKKHLQRYIDEFAGRHNDCNLDTLEQIDRVFEGMIGKQLTYEELIADNDCGQWLAFWRETVLESKTPRVFGDRTGRDIANSPFGRDETTRRVQPCLVRNSLISRSRNLICKCRGTPGQLSNRSAQLF